MPEIPEGATPFEDIVSTLDATSGFELKAGVAGQFIYEINLTVSMGSSVELRLQDGTVIGMNKPFTDPFTNDNLWKVPFENTTGVFLYADVAGQIDATIKGYTL